MCNFITCNGSTMHLKLTGKCCLAFLKTFAKLKICFSKNKTMFIISFHLCQCCISLIIIEYVCERKKITFFVCFRFSFQSSIFCWQPFLFVLVEYFEGKFGFIHFFRLYNSHISKILRFIDSPKNFLGFSSFVVVAH